MMTNGVWSGDVLKECVDLSITFADGHAYLGDHVHSRPHGERMILTVLHVFTRSLIVISRVPYLSFNLIVVHRIWKNGVCPFQIKQRDLHGLIHE